MLGHNYLSTTTEFLCLLLEIVTNIIFAPKERICDVCPYKMTTKPLVSPLQFLSMLGLSWLSADYPLSLQFLSMSDHPLHHSHWISFSQTRKKSWKDLEKFLQVSKKTQSCLRKGLEKIKDGEQFPRWEDPSDTMVSTSSCQIQRWSLWHRCQPMDNSFLAWEDQRWSWWGNQKSENIWPSYWCVQIWLRKHCFDLITPELDHQGGSFAPSW